MPPTKKMRPVPMDLGFHADSRSLLLRAPQHHSQSSNIVTNSASLRRELVGNTEFQALS